MGKLSGLQQRFEESRGGKIVISIFIAVFVLVGVVWNIPDSPIGRSLHARGQAGRGARRASTSTGACTATDQAGRDGRGSGHDGRRRGPGVDHAARRARASAGGIAGSCFGVPRWSMRACDRRSPTGSSARSPSPTTTRSRSASSFALQNLSAPGEDAAGQRQAREEDPVPRSTGASAMTTPDQTAAITAAHDRRRVVRVLVHARSPPTPSVWSASVFGVVAVVWTLALLPDLVAGVRRAAAPRPIYRTDAIIQWGVFEWWSGDTGSADRLGAAAGGGARDDGRLAQPDRRDRGVRTDATRSSAAPFYIFNAGDTILIVVALVLALSCCGAALSLDQRRRAGSFWSAQTLAPWPIRLLQVQMTLIYLVSVQAKLVNKAWTEGSAAFYTWRTDGRWALLRCAGVVGEQRHSGQRGDVGHAGDRAVDRRPRLESAVPVLGARRGRGAAPDDDGHHERRVLQRRDVRAVPGVRPVGGRAVATGDGSALGVARPSSADASPGTPASLREPRRTRTGAPTAA